MIYRMLRLSLSKYLHKYNEELYYSKEWSLCGYNTGNTKYAVRIELNERFNDELVLIRRYTDVCYYMDQPYCLWHSVKNNDI